MVGQTMSGGKDRKKKEMEMRKEKCKYCAAWKNYLGHSTFHGLPWIGENLSCSFKVKLSLKKGLSFYMHLLMTNIILNILIQPI